MGQREGRGHVNVPPFGVIGDPGPGFDEPPDQPLERAPHSLAHDVEPAEHMKQVVGQGPHLEAGLIGFKAVAAGFVPAKGPTSSASICTYDVDKMKNAATNTKAALPAVTEYFSAPTVPSPRNRGSTTAAITNTTAKIIHSMAFLLSTEISPEISHMPLWKTAI